MSDAIGERTPESVHRRTGEAVFRPALLSMALLWLAFPPVGWSVVAWLAPIPLILVILNPVVATKRAYQKLYGVGLLYWLTTFYFIPIPHPLLWFGWLAVSLYMASYTPLLVAASRTMVHRLGIPAPIAVPVVWTGVEYFRCHFATGMGMVCLSHSQYRNPVLIQVADLSGAYSVTWMIATVATCLAVAARHAMPAWTGSVSTDQTAPRLRILAPLVSATLILVATWLYGQQRLAGPPTAASSGLQVAIVQTSQDVVFGPMTNDEIEERLTRLAALNRQALAHENRPDLILWPESALVPFSDLKSDISEQFTVEIAEQELENFFYHVNTLESGQYQPTRILSGVGTYDPANDLKYNSAVLLEDGKVVDRYFKNHLVMFGEYTPLADRFDWIQRMVPMRNCDAGKNFESFLIQDIRVAPNVCFETTVPHLIRRQVNSLAASGEEPDVLVNLTNDGWFFGTSCLDLHLACNVFRAIEMRKPLLVGANTGFSAVIDAQGRMLQVGPRRAEAILHCNVVPKTTHSFYRQFGDVLPFLFTVVWVVMLLVGWMPVAPRDSGRSLDPTDRRN